MNTTLVKCMIEEKDGSKPCITPPIGLWSIRENAPHVDVIDFNIVGERSYYLYNEQIGFSLSFPSQEESFYRALSWCKAQKIILGGPHGAYMDVYGIESIHGPGENHWLGYNTEFNDLQYPRMSEDEMRPYWKEEKPFGKMVKGRWMPMETSRGCAHSCNFCNMPDFWGGWQPKTPERIRAYIRYLKEELGIEHLIFLDDNISYSVERFLLILDILKDEKVTWSCPNGIYARSLLGSHTVMKNLENSGCRALSLPFETGSERSAKLMRLGKKWLNFESASHIVTELRSQNIHVTGFFIIGYPGETEEDVKKTLDYANRLNLDERYIYFATPYEGTRLFDTCVEKKLFVSPRKQGTYKIPVVETPDLTKERLFQLWTEDREAALKRRQ